MTQTTPIAESLIQSSADKALAAVQEAGDKAEVLIQEWVKTANAGAIAEVAERGAGVARKAARRAINVLKSRGITVPERRHVASLAKSAEPLETNALMLAPDHNGTTLFMISSRSKTGQSTTCFVFLRDGQGIVGIENAESSQSKVREYLRRVAPSSDFEPVKVPLEWARSRIARARAAHVERGLIEPLGFDTASVLLKSTVTEVPSHPFDDEGFEFSDEDAKGLAADSARLHQLPEFRPWFPTAQAIDELMRKIGERIPAGEKPAQEELSSYIKEEVQAATDRYFTPERRATVIARMKDAALSILSREGEQVALEVAALIQVIDRAGLVTDAPREIPFLRAYFEKAVSVLAAQGGGSLRIPVPSGPSPAAAESASEESAAG